MIETKENQYLTDLYRDFEEPTHSAFSPADREESMDWKIEAPTNRDLGMVLAAWALLLSRYTGESVVDMGLHDRQSSDLRPLRLKVCENQTISNYVRSIADQLSRQTIREPELRSILRLEKERALFNYIVDEQGALSGTGGCPSAAVLRSSTHLARLVEGLAEGDGVVMRVPHMSDDEYQQVTVGWNPAPTDYPESTVHALFEKNVVESPDAVALVFESQSYTYQGLNALANQLAHYLISSGVQPGQSVAIFLGRGVWQMVSTLAILKAGAVYIPLDSEFPPERIFQMLEDVEWPLIVSQAPFNEELSNYKGNSILLNEVESEMESFPVCNPEVNSGCDALAYIMFTSGSTGRPKGVEVLHRGIIRLLFGIDYVPLDSNTTMLHMAAVSFDASTFEIWGALLHGGSCVLSDSRVPTLQAIGQLILENNVNTLWMTAALFNLTIEEAPEILTPVKYLLAGGEALSSPHVAKALQRLPGTQLINGYGPTENTTFSTTYAFNRDRFDPKRPIPIGRAIGNSSCYILDRLLRPVSVEVTGELYVGGDGLARGYANRPDLTQERFLANPFTTNTEGRMYKTGDLAYWNRDGEIEYAGRTDNQIKLRGFRIELQDIEIALASFPDVEQAVVVAFEDEVRGKWLAGYVKVANPDRFPLDDFEKFAYEKLPDYMVPSVLIPVAEWSYTPSGKLDRKALPKPSGVLVDYGSGDTEYTTATEACLAGILKKLLGLEGIPRDVSFFDLGGDSLRAVTLFLRIQQNFGIDLPLSTLVHASSIAELALLIDGDSEASDASGYRSLQILRRGNEGETPLVLIHGGAGNVLIFNEFVNNLSSSKPVYAFQWSGWDGASGEKTLVEMAEAYQRELLAFNPDGETYHIGGHCVGGLIAIELARLLGEKGIRIDGPIIVSDCPNLSSEKYRAFEPALLPATYDAYGRMVEELLSRVCGSEEVEIPRHPPSVSRSERIKSFPFVVSLVRTGRALPELLRIRLNLMLGRNVSIEHRPLHASVSLVRAAKRHKPTAHAGDILYFRSHCTLGREMGLAGWWDDPFMGFGELCKGSFDAHVVGGGHNDPLANPASAEIVKARFGKFNSN